jgi:hypothetical protein
MSDRVAVESLEQTDESTLELKVKLLDPDPVYDIEYGVLAYDAATHEQFDVTAPAAHDLVGPSETMDHSIDLRPLPWDRDIHVAVWVDIAPEDRTAKNVDAAGVVTRVSGADVVGKSLEFVEIPTIAGGHVRWVARNAGAARAADEVWDAVDVSINGVAEDTQYFWPGALAADQEYQGQVALPPGTAGFVEAFVTLDGGVNPVRQGTTRQV